MSITLETLIAQREMLQKQMEGASNLYQQSAGALNLVNALISEINKQKELKRLEEEALRIHEEERQKALQMAEPDLLNEEACNGDINSETAQQTA